MKPSIYSASLIRHAACLVPIAALGLSLPAHSAVTTMSYWSLGEGATVGQDSSSANDGETNNFNSSTGTAILSAAPSGVAGSTAYAHTSGADFQGMWMFGVGSDNQTIPVDNWGVQFMVRSTNHASIGISDYRAAFGMAEGVSGGLVIETANIGGTVYWDVNRQGIQNLIVPRNALTTVTDVWTALALVKDGGTTNFFVNGQLAGNTTTAYNTSGLFAFGLQQNIGTRGFQGDFDEASFFTFNAGEFDAATDLIPEPSATLLGALGCLTLWRRKRSASPVLLTVAGHPTTAGRSRSPMSSCQP